MTPKEKAKDLVDKYERLDPDVQGELIGKSLAKACALIAVDEILSTFDAPPHKEYWGKVKKEIESL